METFHHPGTIAHHDHQRGLRTVAMIEAVKGVLMLVAGLAFVEVLRHGVDLEGAALNLLVLMHVNPDRHLSHALLHLAERLSDAKVLNVFAVVVFYSSLRFLESYGLWRQKVWAEWLAIASGAIYLPFELKALILHPTPFHWAILLINIAIVVYIAWVRWDEIKERGRREPGAGRLLRDGD
jgi:uncharacterized membrane protein (DUF2068 family)